jgi:hypothetical protein
MNRTEDCADHIDRHLLSRGQSSHLAVRRRLRRGALSGFAIRASAGGGLRFGPLPLVLRVGRLRLGLSLLRPRAAAVVPEVIPKMMLREEALRRDPAMFRLILHRRDGVKQILVQAILQFRSLQSDLSPGLGEKPVAAQLGAPGMTKAGNRSCTFGERIMDMTSRCALRPGFGFRFGVTEKRSHDFRRQLVPELAQDALEAANLPVQFIERRLAEMGDARGKEAHIRKGILAVTGTNRAFVLPEDIQKFIPAGLALPRRRFASPRQELFLGQGRSRGSSSGLTQPLPRSRLAHRGLTQPATRSQVDSHGHPGSQTCVPRDRQRIDTQSQATEEPLQWFHSGRRPIPCGATRMSAASDCA